MQECVTDVQILQYGVLDAELPFDDSQGERIKSLDYAEILLSIDSGKSQEHDDVISMVLRCECSMEWYR